MRFFEPIMAEIEIAIERTKNGEFEAFPLEELDNYFEPLVDEMEQISSVMYSHDNGDEYMLLQTGDAWQSRLSRPASRGNVAAIRRWRSSDEAPGTEEQTLDYDARVRPWFTGALDKLEGVGERAPLRERLHWTPPYRFFTTGDPGITVSLAHRSRTGRIVILGFDIMSTSCWRTSAVTRRSSGSGRKARSSCFAGARHSRMGW
jgi:hypothetical protein